MNLLLINKNPVVSRMLKLSAPKAGFEVEECDNVYELPKGEFDVIFIDDEMYDENFLKEIKRNIEFKQIGLITSSKDEHIEGFDFTLTKPFLPTDLIELLRGVKGKIEFMKKEEIETDLEKKIAKIEEKQKEKVEEETPLNILTLNEVPELEDKKIEDNLPQVKEEIVEFEEEEEEEPFISESEIEERGILDRSELEKVQGLLEEEKLLAEEEKTIEEIQEDTQDNVEEEVEEKKPSILKKVEEYQKEKKDKPQKPEFKDEEKIKALMGVLDLYSIRELLDGMEITIKINFNKKKKKKR